MRRSFVSLALLSVFLLHIATTSAAECYEYTIIDSSGLTQSAINYLSSLTVEACESSLSAQELTASLTKLSSATYGCPKCVSVLATQTSAGTSNAQKLIADWYLVVQTGNYIVTQFVGKDCVSYGFIEPDEMLLTIDENNKLDYQVSFPAPSTNLVPQVDESTCTCTSFTWYSSSGLSSSSKKQLQEAASSACSGASSISSYVSTLYATLYSHYAYSDVIASTSTSDSGFTVANLWYGAFKVGCYETVALHNPEACDGYKPPKVFPTPTAIVGYSTSPTASRSSASSSSRSSTGTPSPSRTPSISSTHSGSGTISHSGSLTPTTSRTRSVTATSSPSPAVSGCGNPPCNHHGVCESGQCHCSSFYYGPQCQYQYCPGNCTIVNGTSHGDCVNGECICDFPYYGCDCSSILLNCTCEHGKCDHITGQCTCDLGWTGTNCNVSVACEDNCNNHGRCTVNETCDCYIGWTGEFCNITDLNCTKGCDNGGYCNNVTGTCTCITPWFGPQCTWQHCGDGGTGLECNGHGKCNRNTGSCYCDPGWSGCFCTVWSGSGSPPPAKSPWTPPPVIQCGTGGTNVTCSGHGQCNHSTGQCFCDAGWQGCYCNQQTYDF